MTGFGERPVQSKGLAHGIHSVCASPPSGKLQQHRASQGVDFRALIRRRVRSRTRVLSPVQADALLTFSPPRCADSIVGLSPSPRPLPVKVRPPFGGPLPHRGGPGYRSDRAWKRLRGAPSTPCGFLTSLPTDSRSPPGMGRGSFVLVTLAPDQHEVI
jgi:hypothetical protein